MSYTEREQFIVEYLNGDEVQEAMMRAGAAVSATISITEIMSENGSPGDIGGSYVTQDVYGQALQSVYGSFQAEPKNIWGQCKNSLIPR